MLGNLGIAIGIALLGGLNGLAQPNTPTNNETPKYTQVELSEEITQQYNSFLFIAKNIENNGLGTFYSATPINNTTSARFTSGIWNGLNATFDLQGPNGTYTRQTLAFTVASYEEEFTQQKIYYLSLVYLNNGTNIYYAGTDGGFFVSENATFMAYNFTTHTENVYSVINRFFNVYTNEEIELEDTTIYEEIKTENIYTYLNGFYALAPKETNKETLNITCDTRQFMSIISGKIINENAPNDILKTYMEVSDTYTLTIYRNLLSLREDDTSANTYTTTYLKNCIYIGNGRVNTSDLQNIKIYKVLRPKLIDERFVNTTIVLNGQINPYQKWGYNVKTDLFIPKDSSIEHNGDFYYYWFEGVAKINDYIVKNIKNDYNNAYGVYYWLNGNTSSSSNRVRFLLQNYMYFQYSYGEWDKRINGKTQGQTTIGTGTDSNRPLVSTIAYAQTEDYTALTYATENKTSEIYFAIMENGYDLETIKLQFDNYYIINDTITGDSVFDLIAKGFKSWQVLFNLQIGTLSVGVLFFAPLLIGFMIWLIHLVKRG